MEDDKIVSEKRPVEASVASEATSSKIIKRIRIATNEEHLHLHEAIKQNNKQWFRELLESKSQDINAQNKVGDTALHLAASKGFDEFIHLLLRKGPATDIKNKKQETFLDVIRNMAAKHERAKEVFMKSVRSETLQSSSPPVNNAADKADEQAKALLHAAQIGHLDEVRALLEQGVSLEVTDDEKRTPLHHAVENNHMNIVRLLLNSRVNVDAADVHNWTPLHLAADRGRTEMVIKLVEKNANINIATVDNWTPLHLASRNGNAEVIEQLLLHRHIAIDAVNEKNCTALHIAADEGFTAVVELLLNKGAEVNARQEHNWTPLHFAAEKGHVEVVKALLSRNADIYLRADGDVTALDLAIDGGYIEVARELKNRRVELQKSRHGRYYTKYPHIRGYKNLNN